MRISAGRLYLGGRQALRSEINVACLPGHTRELSFIRLLQQNRRQGLLRTWGKELQTTYLCPTIFFNPYWNFSFFGAWNFKPGRTIQCLAASIRLRSTRKSFTEQFRRSTVEFRFVNFSYSPLRFHSGSLSIILLSFEFSEFSVLVSVPAHDLCRFNFVPLFSLTSDRLAPISDTGVLPSGPSPIGIRKHLLFQRWVGIECCGWNEEPER